MSTALAVSRLDLFNRNAVAAGTDDDGEGEFWDDDVVVVDDDDDAVDADGGDTEFKLQTNNCQFINNDPIFSAHNWDFPLPAMFKVSDWQVFGQLLSYLNSPFLFSMVFILFVPMIFHAFQLIFDEKHAQIVAAVPGEFTTMAGKVTREASFFGWKMGIWMVFWGYDIKFMKLYMILQALFVLNLGWFNMVQQFFWFWFKNQQG